MVNPASLDDLEARWRPLTGNEQANALAMLDDAWALLTHRLPTLEADLVAETISTQMVIAVVCSMVLRVMRNPDGKRSESIDDYSWTRDNSVAAGALYVSEEELAWLSPSSGYGDAFTITPFGEPGYATNVPLNYWELNL